MDQKKELIIKVLTKLKPYRDVAEGILALVESSYVDEKTIDGMIHIMAKTLKSTKNKQEKMKLQQGIDIIKKLEKNEEQEKEGEYIDQELEKMLQNI